MLQSGINQSGLSSRSPAAAPYRLMRRPTLIAWLSVPTATPPS
jgi:hypothetical protein